MAVERLDDLVARADAAVSRRHQQALELDAQQDELRERGQRVLDRYNSVLNDFRVLLEAFGVADEPPVQAPRPTHELHEVVVAQKRRAPRATVVIQRGLHTTSWGLVDVVGVVSFDAAFTGLTMQEALAQSYPGGPRFIVGYQLIDTAGNVVAHPETKVYSLNPDVTPAERPSRVRLRSLAADMPGRRHPRLIEVAEAYTMREADAAEHVLSQLWNSALDADLNPNLAARAAS